MGVFVQRIGQKMSTIDWQERFNRMMPDDSPPKWLFRNVTTIRDNTDRILKLLDPEGSGSNSPPAAHT